MEKKYLYNITIYPTHVSGKWITELLVSKCDVEPLYDTVMVTITPLLHLDMKLVKDIITTHRDGIKTDSLSDRAKTHLLTILDGFIEKLGAGKPIGDTIVTYDVF
jgi:hypothetical protein